MIYEQVLGVEIFGKHSSLSSCFQPICTENTIEASFFAGSVVSKEVFSKLSKSAYDKSCVKDKP